MTTENSIECENGISYSIIESGSGKKSPSLSDQVFAHYEGRLTDGFVFDSSYKRNEPLSFGLTQVIPGWTYILQKMVTGDKWEVTIPANLAYGAQELPNIPANSTLIFTIELIDIID